MQNSLLNQDLIKTTLGSITDDLEATQSAVNDLYNNVDNHQTSTADILGDVQANLGRLKLTLKTMFLQLDLVAHRLQFAEHGIDNILKIVAARQQHHWHNQDPYWFAAFVMLAVVCLTQHIIIRFPGIMLHG